MDEGGLIQAAQQGDLNAFNHLVLVYQDSVFNQAYRMLNDQDAADDAAQNAFISAYNHIQKFRGGSFRAWLLRIVTNGCYDELRRRQRRPTTSLEPLDDTGEEVESPEWLADTSNMPEDQMEQKELQQAIADCLGRLPDEFRAAVVLVDVQGLDYSEAALALDKPVGTIKSRLARARLRLRDCLHAVWELLPAQFRLITEE